MIRRILRVRCTTERTSRLRPRQKKLRSPWKADIIPFDYRREAVRPPGIEPGTSADLVAESGEILGIYTLQNEESQKPENSENLMEIKKEKMTGSQLQKGSFRAWNRSDLHVCSIFLHLRAYPFFCSY